MKFQKMAIVLFTTLIFISLLSGCSTLTGITNSYHVPEFAQISVKTWKTYDVASHTAYTAAGKLYKDKVISESEKDTLIEQGNILYNYLSSLKTKIQTCIWSNDENASEYEQAIKSDFKVVSNTYTNISKNINLYSNKSSIIVPDIILPDELK